MSRPLVIVGAGRQGRNVLELVRAAGQHQVAGFLDDTRESGELVLGTPVVGAFGRMEEPGFVSAHAWFIALGEGRVRQRLGSALIAAGGEVIRAIHPLASVSADAEIGVGVFIAAFTAVRSGCRVGDWALVEGGCHLGCDCQVGEGVSFGPGCILVGGAAVGALSFVGAGSVVGHNTRVGERCVIGASAAVVRDIPDGSRAYGVPARIIAQADEV